ncbi:Ser/Thr protein phosphatase [Pontibacillus litoralis JSM 072002]|uniref:Ser/Thr protein phosphatase n=1 Tax=Pontibacillus litoralis JSM 072002 TaxID=1385512 RepID=A0A0A5HTV2_9BACI|nr:Ser/Thr protein phosphatase [Pontibacillus litoralis JSM 072002]
MPDPQKTVRYMPELFQKQVEWITEYEQQLNLAFTTFLGDMVDQSDAEEEWHNSSSIIQLLDDSNTAYVTIAGNHDYGDKDPYLDYYSPERFSHKPYYKGASASGYSSYSIVSAGSYEYMILAIDMQHLKVDSKWAEQILAQHPTLPTILVSHEILDISGDGVSPIETWRGKWLWNNLISNNNQIFLTVSGHNHGAAYQIKQNANGQAVIQILVDYQSSYHGGNGWMRFTEFDEINNQIICKTYSPWVDQLPISERTYFDVAYLTGEGDHFTIPFPFKERFDFSSTC